MYPLVFTIGSARFFKFCLYLRQSAECRVLLEAGLGKENSPATPCALQGAGLGTDPPPFQGCQVPLMQLLLRYLLLCMVVSTGK
jgi:hypothetical protein